MKRTGQTPKKGARRAASGLLALALAVSLALAAPSAAFAEQTAAPAEGTGSPVAAPTSRPDLEKGCGLTVKFPPSAVGEESKWDLKEADTAVDLYSIADAVAISGYGGYAYCISESAPWYGLVENYLMAGEPDAEGNPTSRPGWHVSYRDTDPRPNVGEGDESNGPWLVFYYSAGGDAAVDGWAGLVDALAEAFFVGLPAADGQGALGPLVTGESGGLAPIAAGTVGDRIPDLSAGLYLTVLHGADLGPAQYVIRQKVEGGGADELPLRTVAYTATRTYVFQPQLISLPALPETEGEGWVYQAAAVSKCALDTRYATLQLTKGLTQDLGPAVFTFRVTASSPEGEEIFDRVVPFTFDGAGTQNVVIDGKIPVGSTVRIEEVYTGGNYSLVGGEVTISANVSGQPAGELPQNQVSIEDKTIIIENIPAGNLIVTGAGGAENTIPSGDTVTAAFTNSPNNNNSGGGGVVNRFEPNAEDPTARHWEWSQGKLENGGWTMSKIGRAGRAALGNN